MSCFSCASKFGMFNKEHGCKQCGFSFCSKCLQNKTSVPKRNNEIHHVCSKCFDVLSGKFKPEAAVPVRVSPPKALLSMIADNANKKSLSNTRKKQHSGEHNGSSTDVTLNTKGMTRADIEIAQRLNRLKQMRMNEELPAPSLKEIEQRLSDLKAKDGPPPSQEELERRLAVLKGVNPDDYNNRNQLSLLSKNKTEYEETRDLLDEIMDEVRIDSLSSGACGGDNSSPSQFLKDSQSVKTDNINNQDLSNKSLDEIQNLMEITANEVKDEADKALRDLQKDKELWDKLNKLKEERKKRCEEQKAPGGEECGSSVEDDKADVNKVIKEIVARNDLSDSDMEGESEDEAECRRQKLKEQQEFPWCCICNGDAKLLCADCDDDLYCLQCFREGHDDFDLKSHRVLDFKMGLSVG